MRWAERWATPRVLVAIAAVLVAAGAASAWLYVRDGGGSASPSGRVVVTYEPGPPRDVRLLEGSGLFQRAVATMNDEFELPEDIQIQVVGSRTARALSVDDPFYAPRERAVFFPWRFVDRSREELAPLLRREQRGQREDILAAAMEFALYHELAHGLIHILDLPIVGKEEQSADSLATIFAIATDGGGDIVPLSAATLLRGPNGPRQETAADFAADHNLAPERAYDAICLVYGSDPKREAKVVLDAGLPLSRLETCKFDYARQLRSWRRLLRDWLTNKGGLRPLR